MRFGRVDVVVASDVVVVAENPYRRERFGSVELLVLTNLDHLLLLFQIFLLVNKTSYLNEGVHCTELSL
jgi:hypothetical protein